VAVFSAVGDISDEAVKAFRTHQQAISERIRAAKDALAALPESTVDCVKAKAAYDRLAATDMARAIGDSLAPRDMENLRTLLYLTVKSARITERVASGQGGRTAWARAEVDWADDVALLVRAGLLAFGPEPQAPVQPSAKERAAERARRYRARKREVRANCDNPSAGRA
jgi:hypothetical protein